MEFKMPIIDIEKDIKSKKVQFVIKRFSDIILSLIGIIILSPIYLILFLWIKLDSKVIQPYLNKLELGKIIKIL